MDYRLARRPILIALAGSNGAGKSTFFDTFLSVERLTFVNADLLSAELKVDAYAAAKFAEQRRRELVAARESFVFETVLSDPVGEKVEFLREAATKGYAVVLFFIGLDSANTSLARVAQRVTHGGHDVPDDKVLTRYERTLSNLRRAIQTLPTVAIFDNSDLRDPYKFLAGYEDGKLVERCNAWPAWFVNVTAGVS